ncbi:MAG TPA: ABC transporter substrate-binding protein [Candidatus Binatia bacterium]|jgi:ABC-type nitrate/sulfonate/bicarbonate transport system substrate-binding protein
MDKVLRGRKSGKLPLVCALAVPALVILILSTAVFGAELEGERLHIGYSIYAGITAPLWATKEAGLFEKNGLPAQLIYLRGGIEAAQALITGDIPFALMGGGAVIASNLAGSGSVILAGIENTILFKLVTSKEIDSAEKLRGKKLGVASLGGSTYLGTVRALQHFGIKANEATILAIGGGPARMAALQSGSIQGGVFLPPETLIAKKLGLNFLLDLGSLRLDFQNSVVAGGKNVIEKKPETVRKFMKALVEGIHAYKTDREFGLRVLRKYLKTNDQEVIEETYDFYSNKLAPKPYPTVKGMQLVLNDLASRNPKAKDTQTSQLVNSGFLKELDDTGYIDRLYKASR